MFSQLTCKQLGDELKRRGAKSTGRKCELLQRLQDYERNRDFQSGPVVIPDSILVDWPTAGFRQLTMDHIHKQVLPTITKSHIDGYFKFRMGLDQRAVGDSQALTKGQLLLESQRVEACSILKEGTEFYFSGICRAAMKKNLRYSLRVKLGQYGDILNSHCECPSGTGPHGTCKHIAALLLCLVQAVTEKDLCGMNQGSTDRLQTFHKPRKLYTGSPVKAGDIPGCAEVDLVDPRPSHMRQREGRQDFFRNLVTNFVAASKKDITARYIVPGISLQTAAVDHDYLDAPFTEYQVRQRLQICQEDATKLERATTKQGNSGKWHEEREWRLTASRFGEICSVTARRNMPKFCVSLQGKHEISSPAIIHGRIHEPIALQKFQEVSGLKVNPCGLFIDPEYPFLAATPDGVIDSEAIVEVKCPYTARDDSIRIGKKFAFLEEKNGQLTLRRSHNYYDQVQGQLFISKRIICYFVIYTNVGIEVLNVRYDEEYCKNCLLPKLQAFFDKYYVKFIASQL